MSVAPGAPFGPSPSTPDEGLTMRISVEAHRLEELREALAEVSFPVSPQIHHAAGTSVVEFRGPAECLADVRQVMERWGFDPRSLEIGPSRARPS